MDKLIDLVRKDAQQKEKNQVKLSYEIDVNSNETYELIRLNCGASLINTPIGYIQFGIPPGCLTELSQRNLPVPQYFIIPSVRFHKKHAVNLADFAYPVYHNFLHRKKTYLICNPLVPLRLRALFEDQWPLWDDRLIVNDELDFYSSIDKNPIPNFCAEFKYLRGMFSQYNPELTLDEYLDFIVIDKKNGIFLITSLLPVIHLSFDSLFSILKVVQLVIILQSRREMRILL